MDEQKRCKIFENKRSDRVYVSKPMDVNVIRRHYSNGRPLANTNPLVITRGVAISLPPAPVALAVAE